MGSKPLDGYRVTSFGWVLAGPLMGHLLADLGAEVIKIETSKRLDACRYGERVPDEHVKGDSEGKKHELIPIFHAINRGKKSVTINFKRERGAQLIRELVAKSDLVLENFPPGVLDRAGLAYGDLREVNPELVMISLSSAGQTGPLSDIRGYAPTVSGLSGLESLIGYEDGRPLGTIGLTYSDSTGGMLGAYTALSALFQKERTGKGQYIDLSQIEGLSSLLGEAFLEAEFSGQAPGPRGNAHPTLAPHGHFPCRGEDEWIALAVSGQEEWRHLCRVAGKGEWISDPRFSDPPSRLEHREELNRAIAAWTETRPRDELVGTLQDHGVAATPVLSVEGLYENEQFRDRELYPHVPHPLVPEEPLYRHLWKSSDGEDIPRNPAPLLGQHNEEVFREILGLSDDEIKQLAEDEVLV